MTDSRRPSFLAILRRRWWLIALIVAGAVGVTLIGSLNAPTTYRSALRLQVLVLDDQEVTLYSRPRTATSGEEVFITQNDFGDVLRSPLIAWRTIDDLALEMSAEQLLERLTIGISGEFVSVAYEGASPQQAQDVLARHVDNALSHYASLLARPAAATGQFIQAEMSEQGQTLADARNALLAFQLEHNVGDLPREINALQDLLRTLENEQDAAQVESERAAALAGQWDAFAGEAEAKAEAARQRLASAAPPLSDDALAALGQAELQARQDQIAALKGEIAVQEEWARTYRTTARTQAANAAALRAAAAQQDVAISARRADLTQLLSLSSQYSALMLTLQTAQDDHGFLRAKAVEARLKERQVNEVGSLQVVEPAFLPTAPNPSPVLRLTLLAAVVGLLAALVVVLLLELFTARRSA